MEMLLSMLDNALLQGLSYGVAVLGVAVSFRVLRYPDLTPDGSFLLGGSAFGALLCSGFGWPIAAAGATSVGALAGLGTAVLHTKWRVNRLLAGILTTMICYSLGFRILSGKSNLSLGDAITMFTWAETQDAAPAWRQMSIHPAALLISGLVAVVMAVLLFMLLRSEMGIVLRASGENPTLIEELGRRPSRYHTLGLALANALVGLAGGLVAARQGFVDVNMGVGVVITLIASLIIGEDLLRLVGLTPSRRLVTQVLAPITGCCAYYLLYLTMLRASIHDWIPVRIQPTDLKLLSALIVITVIAIRARIPGRRPDGEEVLPI
jgi:putative ABC transport system permease protein